MTTDQNDIERNQTGDAKPFSGGYCEEKIELSEVSLLSLWKDVHTIWCQTNS